MPTISLCMIVKDEEKWLEGCLDSVKPVADEIIIVDTGSSDKTAWIAERLGARLFHYEWDNSFSNARNFAISKASGDWILSLDADERIAEQDLARVRSLAGNKHFDGVSFLIRNYTNNQFLENFVALNEGERYGSQSAGFRGYKQGRLVRMFRNNGILFEREIHEVVEHFIRKRGGRILETDITIHHLGELRGNSESKLGKYEEMSGLRIQSNPNDPKDNFDLGYFYFRKGEHEKSEYFYRKAIKLKPNYLEAHFGLGEAYASQGKYQEAVEANKRILELSPDNAAACYNLGELYMGLGKLGLAMEMYEKALAQGSPQKERILEILEKIKGKG
jgi:glycosyltransferase involved in cell wall biosynthesis